MDYWVYYRGIDIGMEVKRSYIGTRNLCKRTGKSTAVLSKAWQSCVSQATSVRKDIRSWPSKSPIGLAFLTVFIYESSKAKKWPTGLTSEEALKNICKLTTRYKLPPVWFGIWKPYKGEAIMELENTYERVPGVAFLARPVTK